MKLRAFSLLLIGACSLDLPLVPGQGNAALPSVCGDGVVGAGEACDDGNAVDFDACTSLCTNAGCGDGITRRDVTDPLAPGYEACDDGNDRDDDGCTNACLSPKCGDGRVFQNAGVGSEGYEECDDGNTSSSDGCTIHCRVARCGDGFVRTTAAIETAIEGCDDGNQIDTDGCRNNCTSATCGDGVQRRDIAVGERTSCNQDSDCGEQAICQRGICLPIGYEGCDDGNSEDDDACLNGCVAARCGDGITRADLAEGAEGYEACDDGNLVATDACNNDCEAASCGDGVRRADLDSVLRGPSATCELGCRDNEICQGILCVPDGYEACDDGNLNDSDTCVSCELAGSSASSAPQSCLQLLGQGVTESGVYWLDLDGPGDNQPAARYYCDQTTDGGGWLRLFGQGAPSAEACDWFTYTQWDHFQPNRLEENAFDLTQVPWIYQCGGNGLFVEQRGQTRLELRVTLTTPFAFSAIRYRGHMRIATDTDFQNYHLPDARWRHIMPVLDNWKGFEGCVNIVLNENFNPFVSVDTSLSWLIASWSPGRHGCPEDTTFQLDELSLR